MQANTPNCNPFLIFNLNWLKHDTANTDSDICVKYWGQSTESSNNSNDDNWDTSNVMMFKKSMFARV